MEKLNAVEIIKYINRCAFDLTCINCPYNKEDAGYCCQSLLLQDALALIKSQEERIKELAEGNEWAAKRILEADKKNKELTEENERLLARNFDLAEKGENVVIAYKKLSEENDSLHASCTELTQNFHECKADTVSEMQKRLTSFFEADDFVKYNEVDADYINEQISEIANKLLEEKQ